MKWKLLLTILATASFGSLAQASSSQHGPFGLGIVLAGPTGLTANYYYDAQKSISGDLAWGSGYLHLNLDHLWTQKNLAVVDGVGLDIYFGVGARIENRDRDDNKNEDTIGIRFPVGVGYHFQKVPLQLFAELAPALIVVDSSELAMDIALGGRYYF